MATLTGTQIANTYKQLLQVGSGNNGLTASVQNVQDGQGTNSPLQLSQSAVNIDGTFQLNGVTLTANASALNDIADLTGAIGIIAVSGGNVYGRTLTGGTGVLITNADGTEGNPTIALNPTGVVSASYGPATNIEINSVGQVVSAGAATSVSVSGVTANTFTGGTFAGTTGDFSSNVSVGGNLVIAGQFSPASLSVTGTINATKISATDATFNNNVSVGGNLVIAGQFSPAALSVTGTVNAANISATNATFNNNVSVGGNLVVTGQLSPAALSVTGTVNATKISATNATFNSVVSAGFFVGDGSGLINVPSVEGGTVKAITAGTGIKLTVDAAVTTTIPVSGTVAVSANQNFGSVSVSTALAVTGSALFGIVSATNIDTDELLIAGVSAATVTEVAAVSALTQINLDSITSINGIIEGNVSADSGTFNTLTVVTSASVGGALNVGGNVGIGTASPTEKLEVTGNLILDATDADIKIKSGVTGTTGAVRWTLNTDSTSYADISLPYDTRGTVGLLLRTQNGYPITIDGGNGVIFKEDSTTETMRIDTSGNVLIGTSSATTDLAYAPKLKLSGNGPALYLEEVDASKSYSVTALGGKFYIRDATAVVPRLTIDSSGNVGIGNTAPSYLLDLYKSASTVARVRNTAATGGTPSTTHGEFVIESTDANMGMQFLGSTTADQRILFSDTGANSGQIVYNHTNNYMALYTAAAERMRIDSSGNVGIGTSSPDSALHVYKQTNDRSARFQRISTQYIDIGQTSGVNEIKSTGKNFEIGTTDALDFIIDTSNSERMRIDSSGNVGIGTASPSSLLNIYINSLSDREALVLNSNGGVLNGASIDIQRSNVSMGKIDADYFEGMRFYVTDGAGAAATERMRIDAGGNVGIGTSSPSTPLTVAGKGTFSGAGSFEALELITSDTNRVYVTGNSSVSGDMWRLGTSASNPNLNIDALRSNGEILFRTGGTNERMRITSSGNVGIGTTSPGDLLTVKGSSVSQTLLSLQSSGISSASIVEMLGTNSSSSASQQVFLKAYQPAGGAAVDAALDFAVRVNGDAFDSPTTVMTLTSGNVGIGTTAPDGKLNVQRTAASAGWIINGQTVGVANDSGLFMDASNNIELAVRNGSGTLTGAVRSSGTTFFNGGNVGIGTSSPIALLDIGPSDGANEGAEVKFRGATNSTVDWGADVYISDYRIFTTAKGSGASFSEKMRITSSGTLLVGMTAASDTLANTGIELYNDGRLNATRTSNPVLYLNRKTSGGTIVTFRLNGNEEGTISIDSSSGVSYNTTSDYRLKENITEVTGAANRVKALNPVRFNFIAAPDKIVDGFLAHEVSDIVPEAIHGEKDAVDADGNPEYQGIDQSKLVPLLTAALQEALTKIDELEARVAALETA